MIAAILALGLARMLSAADVSQFPPSTDPLTYFDQLKNGLGSDWDKLSAESQKHIKTLALIDTLHRSIGRRFTEAPYYEKEADMLFGRYPVSPFVVIEGKAEGPLHWPSTNALRDRLELTLRKAGVPILAATDPTKQTLKLFLYISYLEKYNTVFFECSLTANDPNVLLVRGGSFKFCFATVYSRSAIHTVGKEKLYDAVKTVCEEMTDSFANAYLSANPSIELGPPTQGDKSP